MADIDVTTGNVEPGSEGVQGSRIAAREEAERLVQEGKMRGKGFLSEQKEKAASLIGDFAGALHSSARQLDPQVHPTSSRYLDQAAAGLERFSGNLRQRDVDSLLSQARDFARRQPILLLVGTLVAGFYLSRLLKSGTEYEKTQDISVAPGEMPLH